MAATAVQSIELSIVVPAWNEEAFIDEALQSIAAAVRDIDVVHELIVVDNNSSDATASLAAAAGAKVVFEPINQIARARNAGAGVAVAPFLLFVDADTQVSSELLTDIVSTLRTGTVVGGGALVAMDAELKTAARWGLALWTWVSKTFRYAAGSCIWCRRDAFEAVGGFSHKHYAGEELVLSRQLKSWGRRHKMTFVILNRAVLTSARKLTWYGPMDLVRQALMALIPGALRSKRLMHTWYDDAGREQLRENRGTGTGANPRSPN